MYCWLIKKIVVELVFLKSCFLYIKMNMHKNEFNKFIDLLLIVIDEPLVLETAILVLVVPMEWKLLLDALFFPIYIYICSSTSIRLKF